VRERNLDLTHSREEFQESFARMRSRSLETDTAALLARFKRRQYIRIMLRDVLGIATLAETQSEISALADVLIEEALREAEAQLHHRFGSPQRLDPEGRAVDSRFAVLSLGKLGGNELNYSSDIDLLFLYDGGMEPPSAEIPIASTLFAWPSRPPSCSPAIPAKGRCFALTCACDRRAARANLRCRWPTPFTTTRTRPTTGSCKP